MRHRSLTLPLAMLLLGLALTSWPSAWAAPMQLQKVADHTWLVQGEAALGSSANRNFVSNAAFVVTPDGVVVIDALGAPALADELIALIRSVTAQPVRWVIVTHYHADHIYGLQAFKAAGAQVMAHAAGRLYIHSAVAEERLKVSQTELFPWIDEKTRVVPADRWVEHDTSLVVGGIEFLIRHAGPAHTQEDLVVFVPATGVLFSGDLVFRGRIPFLGQADSGKWIASIDRLMTLKPRWLVPGHGAPSDDPAAALRFTHDYLAHLRQTMGTAAQNLEPFEEAYAKADWSRFSGVPLFTLANRMNAYNTYLMLEQQGLK